MKTIYLLLITVSLLVVTGCYDPDDYDNSEFDKNSHDQYLALRASADSLAADGRSLIEVTALISRKAKRDFRDIEFTTNKGVFTLTGTSTAKVKATEFADTTDKSRIAARIFLRSDASEGNATITAKVGYLEQKVTVPFYRVQATGIRIQSARFYITSSITSSDSVWATLTRNPGTPTSGQRVDFFVINDACDTVVNTRNRTGYFRSHSVSSDSRGNASVVFSQGDAGYTGRLKIVAYAKPAATVLKDSTIIEVIMP